MKAPPNNSIHKCNLGSCLLGKFCQPSLLSESSFFTLLHNVLWHLVQIEDQFIVVLLHVSHHLEHAEISVVLGDATLVDVFHVHLQLQDAVVGDRTTKFPVDQTKSFLLQSCSALFFPSEISFNLIKHMLTNNFTVKLVIKIESYFLYKIKSIDLAVI